MCFQCAKQGHIKSDCPFLQKNNGFKNKKDKKSRRAYIAWEDNNDITTSNSKNKKQAHLSLMVPHHLNDDEVSNVKLSYDELHDAYNDLHDECLKFYRLSAKQKKIISFLEIKTNVMQEELDKFKSILYIHGNSSSCNKYTSLETKIDKLNQVICIYEEGKMDRMIFKVIKDILMVKVNKDIINLKNLVK